MFSAKFNTSTLKGHGGKELLYLDIFAIGRFRKEQASEERKTRAPPGPRLRS